ncbi:MAG: LysM peptidoglycan-binding domain-containing protein [Acidothermaceae bacterium]
MSHPATVGSNALRLTPSGSNRPLLFVVSDPEPVRRARVVAPAPLRLTRRGRIVGVVLLALVVTALSFVFGLAPSHASTGSAGSRPVAASSFDAATVVVQPGDTLWSIATRISPNTDPRAVVDAIIAANHLSGATVQAGQLLTLPS